MAFLGDRDIELQRDHLVLLPGLVEAWMGQQEVSVPYAAISSMALIRPTTVARGQWIIRLHEGTEVTVAFSRRDTLHMVSINQEAQVRARAARLAAARARVSPERYAEPVLRLCP